MSNVVYNPAFFPKIIPVSKSNEHLSFSSINRQHRGVNATQNSLASPHYLINKIVGFFKHTLVSLK